MKIFWACHFLPYPSTGFGALQRTHHLVRQLSKHFEVHLFAISNASEAVSHLREMGVASAHLTPPLAMPMRLLSGLASIAGPQTYWEHTFANRSLRRALERATRDRAGEGDRDSVLMLDTAFLAPLRTVAPRMPLVITHHNVESDLLRQRASVSHGARRAFFERQSVLAERLEKDVCPIAQLNLVTSRDDETRFRTLAGNVPIAVVPNGVDVDYFRPDPSAAPNPHSLVFAGGMDWFPNREAIQWLATEIWPLLVAREPRRTLTIIGKAPPPEISELAARDNRVRVLGFVPDVRPYVAEASAYICPIRIGGGTRLKVLDALAMGAPLVATALSVEGLRLESGTHYLEANTAAAFVEKIHELDEHPAIRQSLAGSGRSFVESNYAWDSIGDALATRLRALA